MSTEHPYWAKISEAAAAETGAKELTAEEELTKDLYTESWETIARIIPLLKIQFQGGSYADFFTEEGIMGFEAVQALVENFEDQLKSRADAVGEMIKSYGRTPRFGKVDRVRLGTSSAYIDHSQRWRGDREWEDTLQVPIWYFWDLKKAKEAEKGYQEDREAKAVARTRAEQVKKDEAARQTRYEQFLKLQQEFGPTMPCPHPHDEYGCNPPVGGVHCATGSAYNPPGSKLLSATCSSWSRSTTPGAGGTTSWARSTPSRKRWRPRSSRRGWTGTTWSTPRRATRSSTARSHLLPWGNLPRNHMRKYTVLFKHTCPTMTWEEHDPHYASYGAVAKEPFYGESAGKSLDDRVFMKVVDAEDPCEAERCARADACRGWGTIVYLVVEGVLEPLIQSDLVIRLGR